MNFGSTDAGGVSVDGVSGGIARSRVGSYCLGVLVVLINVLEAEVF